MILAKVLNPIVSSTKDPTFEGKKIFVIQPLDEKLAPQGATLLAFDHVQAGPGDVVIVCREGNGCRQLWNQDQAPVNAVICGIVDEVHVS